MKNIESSRHETLANRLADILTRLNSGYRLEPNELAKEYNYQSDTMLKNELSDSDNRDKAQQLLKRIGTALGNALEFSGSPETRSELQTTLLRKLTDSLKAHP